MLYRCPRCHRRLLAESVCPRHPHTLAVAVESAGAESDEPDPRPEIQGFTIERLLGRGGFASVWLACDRQAAPMAVKVTRGLRDPRADREIQIAQTLAPPLVPAYVQHGYTVGGQRFLAMEYMGTDSLALRLARAPADVDARSIAAPFTALCQAVNRVHTAGLVHRDLKPENVFFRSDSEVALIDFGLACWTGDERDDRSESGHVGEDTHTGEILGTALYMAPEQWTHARRVDRRADIYALGVILFEWLTGRPPFLGSPGEVRRAHQLQRCPRVSELSPATLSGAPAIDTAIDRVVQRALAKFPDERYQSALEVAHEFARALDIRAAVHSIPGESDQPGARRLPVGPDPRDEDSATASAMALLYVHVHADERAVAAYARSHDAIIARVDTSAHILAFPWARSVQTGVRGAVKAAREGTLWSTGHPCVVHVSPVRARSTRRGIKLHAPALQQNAGWYDTPAPDDARILLTSAAAAYTHGAHPVDPDARWFAIPDVPALEPLDAHKLEFRGHGRLLDEIVAGVGQVLHTRVPCLWSLMGDLGVGKTRALGEIARRMRVASRAPGSLWDAPPELVYYACGDPEYSRAHELPRALLCATLGLHGSPVESDIERALDQAWTHVTHGEHGPDDAIRSAAVWLLRDREPHQIQVSPFSAPGVLERHVARALAYAWVGHARKRPLIIMLDDAHLAVHTVHEAVELATRPAPSIRLAVVTTISAERELPGSWQRASEQPDRGVHQRMLAPLGRDSAGELIADLLHPVEFLPSDVIDRLYRLADGVPLYLVELARALRERGAIRKHVASPGWFIDAEDLPEPDEVAARGATKGHLAGYLRDSLPASLWAQAELCAVLGHGFSVADLEGVYTTWHRARASSRSPRDTAQVSARGQHHPLYGLDLGVGVQRLIRHSVLSSSPRGLRFRHALFGHGIESAMSMSERRAWHAAALEYGSSQTTWPAERLARHASHAGADRRAAELYLELAEAADAAHRFMDAEQGYDRALEYLIVGREQRMRALAGRARMRYRLQRMDEALVDLSVAIDLAAEAERASDSIRLRFERAKVLDWLHEFQESARVAEQAAVLVRAWQAGESRDPETEPEPVPADIVAAMDLAMGRTHYRRDQFQPAAEALSRAASWARAAGDYESLVIALLLLAPALVYLDRLDSAEQYFEEVIQACERAGDDFHRAVAYMNRSTLWSRRQAPEPLIADMQRCRALGQELGNAQIVRLACYNLAETYYWRGAFERGLELAEQARDLQLRFFASHSYYEETLLCARISCTRQPDKARAMLQWLEQHCDEQTMTPAGQVLWAMVREAVRVHERVLQGAHDAFDESAWHGLARTAKQSTQAEEHTEILTTAAETAARVGCPDQARAWLARARECGSHLWTERLDALSDTVRTL